MSSLRLPMGKARESMRQIESCSICRYYEPFPDEDGDPDEDDEPTGICRRFPPVTIAGADTVSVYPEVSGLTGWCGEFTPKV